MTDVNFNVISNINNHCTHLTQAVATFSVLLESIEDDFGYDDKDKAAAFAFWNRRTMYLKALYLIYREVFDNVASIREELEKPD